MIHKIDNGKDRQPRIGGVVATDLEMHNHRLKCALPPAVLDLATTNVRDRELVNKVARATAQVLRLQYGRITQTLNGERGLMATLHESDARGSYPSILGLDALPAGRYDGLFSRSKRFTTATSYASLYHTPEDTDDLAVIRLNSLTFNGAHQKKLWRSADSMKYLSAATLDGREDATPRVIGGMLAIMALGAERLQEHRATEDQLRAETA